MITWFSNLPVIAQVLLALPVVIFAVGAAIFIIEPPGDSFYGGQKPTLLRAIGATMVIGTVGTILLSVIYGMTAAILFVFSILGAKNSWLSDFALIVAIIVVLGGIAWYLEIRHYK